MTTSTRRPPRRRRHAPVVLTAALAALATMLAPAPAGAATASFTATGRVSVTSAGVEHEQSLGDVLAVSRDGRRVAFSTTAPLAAGDTDGTYDVHVRDRLGGVTRRVSLTDADTDATGPATLCDLSRDGRFVAFVAGGAGWPLATRQIYLRDLWERTTTLVSVSSDEQPSFVSAGDSGIGDDVACAVSDNGRYLAFVSGDGDLAPGASYVGDVFRRNLMAGTTELVNVGMSGAVPNDSSDDVDISANGGVIAFASEASNLVTGDSNGDADVFVRVISSSSTIRLSVKAGGAQVDGASDDPSITADGVRVSFVSSATDLVASDTNAADDVFVRDRQANTVVRASIGPAGQLARGGSRGRISDDGRYASFVHWDPLDLPGDLNHDDDVLRRDLQAGTTTYASVARSGLTGSMGSVHSAISGDGSVVAFSTESDDLVRNDDNNSGDVFVRDDVTSTTPFANPTAFVTQQFEDFAGRVPTASELSSWKARLDHGEVSPEEVVDSLAHSNVWSSQRGPVIRLYWAFFERVPDKGGMDYWIGEAQKGLSLAKMASKFAQSQEFKTKYGPLSNSAFVTAIYQNIFDRDPEPAGLAYWKGELDSGARTRGDVMVGFSESAEGRLLLAPAVDSVLVWLGMMRTVPPSAWNIEGVAEGYGLGEPPEIIPEAILAEGGYADRVS
ncbi:MAG TPA: DUF4214 domain-containing protein [Iamia sp.]|nr:DUF4214 domain-containing protein [Iamia sp.]